MTEWSEREVEAMEQALTLAAGVRRITAPNPWVGCVIVAPSGLFVGEGATAAPGGRHAELAALAAAGERARGATAVVTLEPCAHHGRTPPCIDALAEAGIARVVIGIEDPDDLVAGRGVVALRDRGIQVVVGARAREVRTQLAPYIHQRRTGRAFVVAKSAMSLDGRVAAADGTSQWITGPVARADGHRLRAESQAVMVGAGTALADQPTLTPRDVEGLSGPLPVRVLLDAAGRVPPTGPLFDATLADTLVITTDAASAHTVDGWRAAGAKVEIVDAWPNGVDLLAVLELLAGAGVLQVLVEGGPTLHGALWDAGLVDEFVAYMAPTVLGSDALPALIANGPATLADAHRLQFLDSAILGPDIRLRWRRI
ncbi:MAG: bifunctional diaminohydroxyphosphoribosylaminopyrimidine deaminase/5-amino-6-(5-phosphoribosylamino)uracil reductase RibD [Acidimicrobiia bacterium]